LSGGDVLRVETTALAAHALLRAGLHQTTANKALVWLLSQRDPEGTWMSTQATVAAMRAILVGTTASSSTIDGPVAIAVSVNGRSAGGLRITPETSEVHQLLSLREHLRQGKNSVTLELSGKGTVGYQLVGAHYRPWRKRPAAGEEPLSVSVRYDSGQLRVSDIVTATLTVRYNRPGTARMLLVDLGVPAGFEPLTAPLDDLVSRGILERYALTGPQLVLYFREVRQGEPIELSYGLRALHPVEVRSPAARAYLYYEPAIRAQSEPVALTVR
jgi:uncharacterized protein YfaS (alpha-2-macroglobulin family)